MLVNCPSCNTCYLVNSVESQPDGRDVKCVKCNYTWFQKASLNKSDNSNYVSIKSVSNSTVSKKKLPSTIVQQKKPSVINSILVVVLLVIAVSLFWFINNMDSGIIYLFEFYIQEIIDNIFTVINNFANFVYNIIN